MDYLTGVPTCALTCLTEVVSKSTCALTDFSCICPNPEINAQLQPCVLGTCSVKEALTAQNFTYTICQYPTADDTTVFPITNIVGIIVAIVSVALRLTNRAMDKRLGLDDYLITLALLFAAAVSGIGIKLKDYGLGKDIWTVPFEDIRMTLKMFFIEELLYCICIAIVKCSILMLYLRLFPNRGLRIATFVTLGATLLWGFVAFWVLLFSCKPIHYYWNEWDGEHQGTCLSHNNILVAHSTINIILDVVVLVLPVPVLLKLQMPLKKRIGVVAMFVVGIAVTVISIFRLVETVGFNSTTNPTRDFVPVGIWSLLEFDVAIMCACMPAMRSLFIRLYTHGIKGPLSSYANSQRAKGSSAATGSNNSSQPQYSGNFTSKANPNNPDSGPGQFIRLREIETGDELDRQWAAQDPEGVTAGSLPPPTPKRDSQKRFSLFSLGRKPNEPRSPGSSTLPLSPHTAHPPHSPYASSAQLTRQGSFLRDQDSSSG
ncbi:CFEM domain-containing protein [Aspergillus stella-maris]|uniref:CFEM domain-containing protein n=1 Tax=Aspergillus stella-maris TaxID=1810926 RepID=UPI003CCDEAE7